MARSAAAADAAAASPSCGSPPAAPAAAAAAAASAAAAAAVRLLARKAAEVEATLGKHLAKEEAQLLPLVLAAFDAREQARLVAQFLCSIPLAAVRETLAWLASASGSGYGSGGGGAEAGGGGALPSAAPSAAAPSAAASAQSRIAGAVAGALPAGPLAELVASWLSEEGGGGGGEEEEEEQQQQEAGSSLGACGTCAGCGECGLSASPLPPSSTSSSAAAAAASAPLRHIAVLHAALGASLRAFAADARALAAAAAASEKERRRGEGAAKDGDNDEKDSDTAAAAAAALPAMADRLRFLRSVLAYHAASEDDVLMPVARRLAATAANSNGGGGTAGSGSAAAAAPSASAAPSATAAAELAAAALAAEDRHHHHSTDDEDEEGDRAVGHGAGESACLERVGVLLNDVRARARRGGARAAVAASLASLASAADDAASTIGAHMDAEERGVLPALQQALCHRAQAVLLWGALRSMPARVLRQLLPWLSSCLGASAARELVGDACVGAGPRGEQRAEARLLRSWCDGLEALEEEEGELELLLSLPVKKKKEEEKKEETAAKRPRTASGGRGEAAAAKAGGAAAVPALAVAGAPAKEEEKKEQQEAEAAAAARLSPAEDDGDGDGDAPIDHIFQFHKALRRDLRAMEGQVAAFADALDAEGGSGWRRAAAAEWGGGEQEEEAAADGANADAAEDRKSRRSSSDEDENDASPAAARALEGRFRFLQGVYKAHSDAEDNIVFPALEAREALRRVSHAYTLDHEQEGALFAEVERQLLRLRAAPDLAEARAAARDLAARTAALRASLETHVTAEERELWPLFAENFSTEEQEALVGLIVGRTGAEVLAATLPWVAAATTPREAAAMWESLRSAARGTAFGDWLVASRTVEGGGGESGGAAPGPAAGAAAVPAASPGRRGKQGGRAAQPGDALDAVVEYLGLAKSGGGQGGSGGGGDGSGSAAAAAATATTSSSKPNAASNSNSATFRPGWEALFTMNQAQLESAVRLAWTDEGLEPARRAYLAQNIMAARFVVSQQRQKQQRSRASAAAPASAAPDAAAAAAAPAAAAPDAAAAASAPRQQHHHEHYAACKHEKVPSPASTAPVSPPPACPHYSRRTRVVAPCCERAHGCRHCHDEAEDHRLAPSQISAMLCASCGVQGPAAMDCSSCGARQARYFCGICRLWDDTPGREIYHCPFCNLCRLGKGLGVDAQHCMGCNSCMALAEHASHACRRLPEACPACAEPLFDSPRPYRQFPCGEFFVVCSSVFYECSRFFSLSLALSSLALSLSLSLSLSAYVKGMAEEK